MTTESRIRQAPALQDGSSYDVIVVGARAAGAATAMLLARSGVRTLLLDRGAPGSDTLSTHALMRGGVLQLSRWGLLDEITAAGTPAVRSMAFHYGFGPVVLGIDPTHGVDALYAPRRTLLDPLLVRAAEAAGAEVHHRTGVSDLITRDGQVVGVRATAVDERFVELHAPLVIGADGIRSTIARLVGAEHTRVGTHGSAVSYGYWSDLPQDGYLWNFFPAACSGIIPTNDGQACVFVSAPHAVVERGGVERIIDVAAQGSPELAERLRRATPPHGTRTFAGHRGYLRQSWGPGWALVGDAGYFKDPLSAHGLTDALRDAELLARAVIESHGNSRTLPDALHHYQSTRDRLSLPLFDVIDRIASHAWDSAEIGDLLIHLSASMADEVETLATLDHVPSLASAT